MSEAAECRSNVDCPGNSSQCVVNCSAVAVNTFNQPASHGNCRISINSEGYVVQDCYIDECSTSHPDLCVLESALGDDAVSCCCTEDECNSNFSFPPEDPKNSTGVSYLFILSAYVLAMYSIVKFLQLFHLDQEMGHTYIPHTLLMPH